MTTQSIIQQVQWQDLKVRNEVDVVLEIAKKEGWEDCEIFGYGNMITQPQESTGWKLIPADLYEDSIPTEGIARVHRIINAGVRIQGVIIADDERRTETPPTPANPKVPPPSVTKILSLIDQVRVQLSRVSAGLGRALGGLGRLLAGLGRLLIRLISIAGAIALIALFVYPLIASAPTILFVGIIAMIARATAGSATGVNYDPKLVILVDDGNGSTVWVSVLTWYD